jgi:hypothetical protein
LDAELAKVFLVLATRPWALTAVSIVIVFNNRLANVEAFAAGETPNRLDAKEVHNPVEWSPAGDVYIRPFAVRTEIRMTQQKKSPEWIGVNCRQKLLHGFQKIYLDFVAVLRYASTPTSTWSTDVSSVL